MNRIFQTLATVVACTVGSLAYSHTETSKETNPMLRQPLISIPANHTQSPPRHVTIDGEAAVLTRHIRSDGRNPTLGGEHFSTVVSSSGVLKGFAHMSLDMAGQPLPTRERSESIARAFLQQHAPDLLPGMKISWIEPHDEPIKVKRGERVETIKLTGMKVKARNLADNKWFWVIVGANEHPMVFERDIVWISFPGHRKTEKWLHDSWLESQVRTLPKQKS